MHAAATASQLVITAPVLDSKNQDRDAASQGIIDIDLAVAAVGPVHQEEAGKINRRQHMTAQTGAIPMQAGDRKLCEGYRGKDDMQDEETCEFLNANDDQLRNDAKRGAIREDIREPLPSYQLRIRGRDTKVCQAFDPPGQVDLRRFLAAKEFLQAVHRTSPGFLL
jgi:hypothetical protein